MNLPGFNNHRVPWLGSSQSKAIFYKWGLRANHKRLLGSRPFDSREAFNMIIDTAISSPRQELGQGYLSSVSQDIWIWHSILKSGRWIWNDNTVSSTIKKLFPMLQPNSFSMVVCLKERFVIWCLECCNDNNFPPVSCASACIVMNGLLGGTGFCTERRSPWPMIIKNAFPTVIQSRDQSPYIPP